jgi:TRAP transporter 4TM/12TM fusion protein
MTDRTEGAPAGKAPDVEALAAEGNLRRALPGIVGQVWRLAAVAFVSWHLWALLVAPPDPTVARAVHVFFGAALGFALVSPWRGSQALPPWYDWVLIAICVAIPFHYILDADGIELRSFMGPNAMDLAVAVVGILLVLEFARRTAGLAMPIIALVFIGYVFVGPWMPGVLYHRGFDATQAAIEIFGNNGVLGTIVQVSATFIIMFVTFAAFLNVSKAGDYFNDLAIALVGRARGGPAKVTVVSGLMFGTISGSSVANVVASGTFTIPMMRRVGYDAETAAAVEATSSTGGQIAPPVMGAGAFIMAETLGVPYTDIALAAVIPALLFYVANYLHCDLHARRHGLRGLSREELPRWTSIARRAYLALPLVLLVAMLVIGFSPFRAAAYGIAAALGIMFATGVVHRLAVGGSGPLAALGAAALEVGRDIWAALADSAREVLQLVAVCAAAGIVAGVIGLTGVGARFASVLLDVAGAWQFGAMLFVMVVATVLGMGVPTTAAYAIAAAVCAPALIRLGVEPLVAHMFIFYFAALSAITPPIALASFAAAGLANADLWRTSVIAVKLGLATFIVPFMFWISPALLGYGTVAVVGQALATALLGVWLLACAAEGWMLRAALPAPLRVVAAVAAILLMVPEALTDLLGLLLALGLVGWMWRAGRERTT